MIQTTYKGSTVDTERPPPKRWRSIICLVGMALITLEIFLRLARVDNATIPASTPSPVPQHVLEKADPTLHSSTYYRLHTQWQNAPTDPASALPLARWYIEQAQTRFDPRLWGFAQATLQPWWESTSPPVDLLLLRAIVRQHAHDFVQAETDLDQVLAREPHNAQAHLTRAVVLNIQGKFAQAQRDCYALALRVDALTTASCVAYVTQLTAPQKALTLLQKGIALNQATTTKNSSEKSLTWAFTLAGEIASRLSQTALANQYFAKAYALTPDDQYLLAVWADHLLSQKRWQATVDLLSSHATVCHLLLRQTLAEKALKNADGELHARQLDAEFEVARQRQENFHWREYARFQLEIKGNPGLAADAAKQNWQTQREAIDLVLLKNACVANADTACVAEALQWQIEKHIATLDASR